MVAPCHLQIIWRKTLQAIGVPVRRHAEGRAAELGVALNPSPFPNVTQYNFVTLKPSKSGRRPIVAVSKVSATRLNEFQYGAARGDSTTAAPGGDYNQ
jgi:hypothetical protein